MARIVANANRYVHPIRNEAGGYPSFWAQICLIYGLLRPFFPCIRFRGYDTDKRDHEILGIIFDSMYNGVGLQRV